MKKILLLTSLIFLFACSGKQEPDKVKETPGGNNTVTLTEAQMRNAGIVTGKMEQKNIASVLKANGRIDVPPQNKVSISVPLGGYLKETKLLPGMHVRKGEAIAIMEDPQYIQLQQDYLTAKSKLAYSEAEYNRQKELNQSKAVSDKVFQQSLNEYTSQKVLVKSLSEKLKLAGINPSALSDNNLSGSVSIFSPIEGFVSKVNVNTGKYVKPEEVLFEIINPDDIHLSLEIFEKDICSLSEGQKVIAYTNNNPEKKYECEIMLIGKDFSEQRSVEVHCHFKKAGKNLIPGMFMNAEIEVKDNRSSTLPTEALVSFENKQYVFMKKMKNEFEIIEVKTGNSEDGYTEIFPVGDKNFSDMNFVVKGAYSLLMKMKNTGSEEAM